MGWSDKPKIQAVILVLLFITYMLSIIGNLTIITLTPLDSHLQILMYFFQRNFSLVKVSFTTVTIPKFLRTIVSGNKTISFNDCIAQLFCWESKNFILWLPCPMIAILPSANLWITWPSWIQKSARCLSLVSDWLHSCSSSLHLCCCY